MNSTAGLDRRKFLQLAAGSVAFIVGDQVLLAADLPAQAQASAAAQWAQRLPKFDGVMVFEAAALRARAEDFGHWIHRTPIAVFLPKSTQDIQKLIAFCNQEKIKVAVRGAGHSAYGQTQVEQGIVIDTSAMKAMTWISNRVLEVQPGANWKEVLDFTIQKGLTPVVLPESLFISVGGTLNAGGIGETSYRVGALVDNVDSIEVVLGDGRLTACSSAINKELYQMILAGMGQCGIITRARIKLIPTPIAVASRDIQYSNLNTFMNDLYQVSLKENSGAIGAHMIMTPNGTWNYVLSATSFLRNAQDSQKPSWLNSMRGEITSQVVRSYNDYANRNTQSYLESKKSGALQVPHPNLSFFVAANKVLPLLNYILTTPEAYLGVKRIGVSAQFNLNFSLPLQRLPETTITFHIQIERVGTHEGDAEHQRMLNVTQNDLVPKVLAAGGTFYLPFTPILTKSQIQQHYGQRVFNVFSQAKKNLDKNNILNPGAGIF